jgi:hypothetical protein
LLVVATDVFIDLRGELQIFIDVTGIPVFRIGTNRKLLLSLPLYDPFTP